MTTYIFTLLHDKGEYKLKVIGTTLSKAVNAVMRIEGCPERAITNIKIINN
jgi:hypothetical protein